LEIMGKVWPIDAVAKNASTSIYGNIVSLAESPKKEGLLYVGTDDGLINVSLDGGQNWKRYKNFHGVPEFSYVSCITPSLFDENVVFATFDNHKMADFKPYILKSSDKGKSWTNISSNLEEPDVVYTIVQDHKDKNLLFIGTEYGVYFSYNEGKKWIQLKSGLPTIAVRDIAIQHRESDLVLGTFGRSFYILDNYSPLRNLNDESFEKPAIIFPIKDALMFVHERPLGSEKGSQGDAFYTAKNPDFGATFTYYLKESPKTKKQVRKEKEKEAIKNGEKPPYPSFEELEAESLEKAAYLLFTIKDASGNIIRRLHANASKGLQRITWDLRYASNGTARLNSKNEQEGGLLTLPGEYSVQLDLVEDGKTTALFEAVKFTSKFLHDAEINAVDRAELLSFTQKISELRRVVSASIEFSNNLDKNSRLAQQALKLVDQPNVALLQKARTIELENKVITKALTGDKIRTERNAPVPQSINGRLGTITWELWKTNDKPTQTHYDSYQAAKEEFDIVYDKMKKILVQYKALEADLEKLKAPNTPGRLPDWK